MYRQKSTSEFDKNIVNTIQVLVEKVYINNIKLLTHFADLKKD